MAPRAVGVFFGECLCRIAQVGPVVRGRVPADPPVVNSLRGVFRIRIIFGHRAVTLFGIGPIFSRQRETTQTHLKVSPELFFRQIAFQPPSFLALGVEDQDGRRPERVETTEVFRIFFYVYFEGNEILVDERRQTGVLIRLLFEPDAGTSTGCRTEIDKQRFVLIFGLRQRLIGVLDPIYGHN